MISSLKFMAWKAAELLIYVAGFPFLFIGVWAMEASDWCHDKAIPHGPVREFKG